MNVDRTTSSGAPIEIMSSIRTHAFPETWYTLVRDDHFWFRWRFEALMRQLVDLELPIHRNLRALDVGCGTGALRAQIEAATAWDVDVTDLDFDALRHVPNGRGRSLYYDISDQRSELHQRYDVVLLFDVLEHIEETHAFICSVLFHLKPGGVMLVNVPAARWLYSHYDRIVGHVRRYDKPRLRREFRAFRVSIRDMRYWGLVNLPILFLRKLWLSVSRNKSAPRLIARGFEPPSAFVNRALLTLMRLELGALKCPPCGSSLLAVLEKDA